MEDLPHLLRQSRVLRPLEQRQVRLRAIRVEVRNPEALRQRASAVEPLERRELPHAEAGREVRPQAEQRGRGGLPGVERAIGIEALAAEDVREELRLVELAGGDLPLREEVPEAGGPPPPRPA